MTPDTITTTTPVTGLPGHLHGQALHPQLPHVIIYSQNNCSPCLLTKMALKKRQVPFVEVNLDRLDPVEQALARDYLATNLQAQASPVVVAHNARPAGAPPEHWSQFRPERIQSLAAGWHAQVAELVADGVISDAGAALHDLPTEDLAGWRQVARTLTV